MNSRVSALTVCVVVGALFAWVTAFGQVAPDARIEALRVDLREQQVLASLRLADAFDDELHRRVDSGLPTSLVYQFQLERDRSSWFDQSMAESQLQVIAMYNAVTGEYLINFKHDGRLVESRVVRDADTLRQAMTELESFPVFAAGTLELEERYSLRARAELGTRNLLAFIPRTVETAWAESRRFGVGDADATREGSAGDEVADDGSPTETAAVERAAVVQGAVTRDPVTRDPDPRDERLVRETDAEPDPD